MVDKSFECENASENAAPRFDPIHNPSVPYLTDSKITFYFFFIYYCTIQNFSNLKYLDASQKSYYSIFKY